MAIRVKIFVFILSTLLLSCFYMRITSDVDNVKSGGFGHVFGHFLAVRVMVTDGIYCA